MSQSPTGTFVTPRRAELGLAQVANDVGFAISLLPSGALFALEHEASGRRIMINQGLAGPVADGMARLFLRTEGGDALPLIGPAPGLRFGVGDDRVVWRGEREGIS
jgi:hypothetical protein